MRRYGIVWSSLSCNKVNNSVCSALCGFRGDEMARRFINRGINAIITFDLVYSMYLSDCGTEPTNLANREISGVNFDMVYKAWMGMRCSAKVVNGGEL